MKITIQVVGRVQGVGFRYMTKIVADKLYICGIVRNEPNGDVYIEAMGEKENINIFIQEIKKSPAPFGRVDQIDLNENADFPDYNYFSIIS